jgi:predicted DNA binding CopG/RHH family protein
MTRLSREERDIVESFEADKWASVPNLESEIKRFQKIGAVTLRKRRIHINISAKEWEIVRRRAFEKGLSEETLVSDIIHKYLAGQLVEAKRRAR